VSGVVSFIDKLVDSDKLDTRMDEEEGEQKAIMRAIRQAKTNVGEWLSTSEERITNLCDSSLVILLDTALKHETTIDSLAAENRLLWEYIDILRKGDIILHQRIDSAAYQIGWDIRAVQLGVEL